MNTFEYHAFHGYYNTHYHPYIQGHVRAIVGGGEMREDVGRLDALQKELAKGGGWRTRPDWEGRTRHEISGAIEHMPLVKKWLERVQASGNSDQ